MFKQKRSAHGKVIIFNKEHNTVIVDKVEDADADTIEVHGYILPMNESMTRVDPVHGEPVYIFNLDVPAAIEAENLKKLRRSQALKNMFQFERGSSMDIMKLMPWFIIALLILFK
jgi:hypothetical protein